MESTIRELVNAVLKEAYGLEGTAFVVEQPKDLSHGDYATNVALMVSKQLGKNPKEIAEAIVEKLQDNKHKDISDISVAGAGFINFTLSKEFFNKELKTILKKEDEWGKSGMYKGNHILVEHSSPNLFKQFHIGHIMNNAIGESINRLAKFSSASVKTISFPSDISLGIAKTIYRLLQRKNDPDDEDFNPEDIATLSAAYITATAMYDEDESIHPRVKEIADNLYGNVPSEELDMYKVTKKANIKYFEDITARLGSHFDAYIYESEAGVEGKNIVLKNTPSVFTESDGAIVYVPEEGRKDINTAVFINSQGNPTYEAKDIGLLSMKFAKEQLDFSIFITDNHQVSHFQVVLDAAHKIDKEWSDKSIHVHHGRMSFNGTSISSRFQGAPLAETVINMVAEGVKEKALRDAQGLRPADIDMVAIGALKFSVLRATTGKDIDFDSQKALSFEGDSGPYLQYSTVRAKSVLAKAGHLEAEPLSLENWQTTDLEKLLIHFPEVVEHAIQDWSPHFIVTYLLELAQAFNSWYGNTKIIDDADIASPYKLALTKAFAQTMTNGLDLLGISVPDKM